MYGIRQRIVICNLSASQIGCGKFPFIKEKLYFYSLIKEEAYGNQENEAGRVRGGDEAL